MYNLLSHVTIPKDLKLSDSKGLSAVKRLFGGPNKEVALRLNHKKTPTKTDLKNLDKKRIDLKSHLDKVKLKKPTKKEQDKIDSLISNIKSIEDNLDVSLNTSLQNYIDPRIVVAWAKGQNTVGQDTRDQDILKAIYSQTLQTNFAWAIELTDEDWDWATSPLVISTELEPKDKPGTSKPDKSKPDKSKPDKSKPDKSKPGTSKPDKSKPDKSKPDKSKPDKSKPDKSKPDKSKPDKSKPDKSKPDKSKDKSKDNINVPHFLKFCEHFFTEELNQLPQEYRDIFVLTSETCLSKKIGYIGLANLILSQSEDHKIRCSLYRNPEILSWDECDKKRYFWRCL